MVEPELQPVPPLIERLRFMQMHGLFIAAQEHKAASYLEAADALEAISAENAKLREALTPFASAASKGQAVYDGVKALLKRHPELSTYSTAYIDAGRSTAAACLCWNDYANAIAALKEPRS